MIYCSGCDKEITGKLKSCGGDEYISLPEGVYLYTENDYDVTTTIFCSDECIDKAIREQEIKRKYQSFGYAVPPPQQDPDMTLREYQKLCAEYKSEFETRRATQMDLLFPDGWKEFI